MQEMIPVEEAIQILNDHVVHFGTEQLPLDQCMGRILAEDFVADRDMPPYDRVTMDGIALAFSDYASGQRQFAIVGMAAAGSPQQQLTTTGTCLEAMTGASLPVGTDTVIRYEDLTIANGTATVNIDTVTQGQNVHNRGEDRAQGALVVPRGTVISSAEVGVGATLGKHQVQVSRSPKTVIISTGDELVEVNEQPLPHQIRKSNIYRLGATMARYGIQADKAHLDDKLDEIIAQLEPMLQQYEVIMLSGGVSKGKFDFLPEALTKLGVQKQFHKIKQRPGKPFWFGRHPGGALVFALPGNPVSSFMCTQQYFIPWLLRCLQATPQPAGYARLARAVHFKPDLTYFAQVHLQTDAQGVLWAHPEEGHGSGDLANLVQADAFIELPRGKDVYPEGQAFKLLPYR